MSDQELRRWAIEQAIELNHVGVCDVVYTATVILAFVCPPSVVAPAVNGGKGEWTPERVALLDAKWATTKNPALLLLINALPGRPIKSIESLVVFASKRGLNRGVGFRGKRAAKLNIAAE